uniref:Transmembrane protein n=1 Tax=Plectus sambesii TaxID=2011161 RepID=A0A914WEC0_9BILA
MYPRRLLTAVFSLLLLQRTMAVMTEVRSAVIRPLAADNKTSSITSTSTLSTTTGTTEEVTSKENADILGCQWPEDFIERFEFCANKAAIDQDDHGRPFFRLLTRRMDNSVLCWNVAHDECDDDCSALAAELNCLQSDCAAMSLDVLQELGIWQWYFMNTANARKVCAVEEGQCAVGQDALGGANTGIGTLFDGVLWRKKMRKMARDVESTFGVSIQVAVAISLAVLAAFCASCTALCAYRAGMCGDDRRVRRYSRLDEGERFEESSRALTKAVDIDGLDD